MIFDESREGLLGRRELGLGEFVAVEGEEASVILRLMLMETRRLLHVEAFGQQTICID